MITPKLRPLIDKYPQASRASPPKGVFWANTSFSATCPVLQFADHHLIAASKHIPYLGSPTPISCLINDLVHELASRQGDALKDHQAKLEQSYWENDVLFNMKDLGDRTTE